MTPQRDRTAVTRHVIVVMGVAGAGKSAIGAALAASLGVVFLEGDMLHTPENVAKMRRGVPLTDEDRREWLNRIGVALRDARERGDGVVVSCSALKRTYRDRLRTSDPAVRFVHLAGSATLIRERLLARRGHYMPASLLDSQLAALEPPAADECALTVDIRDTPEHIVAAIAERLRDAVPQPPA